MGGFGRARQLGQWLESILVRQRSLASYVKVVPKQHASVTGVLEDIQNRTSRPSGFTIVEVMVVLAVTGALFISAVSLISGRQNRTQFTVAINEVESQTQQVISDVSTGFYPTANNINCSLNAATNTPQFSAGSNQQGTNQDCTFMGKAIQFGIKNTNPEAFWVYSLAGLRQIAGGIDAQTLTQANPKIVTLNPSNPTDTTTDQEFLRNGLTTGKMTYTNGGVTKDIVAVAFVSDLSPSASGLVSGAQAVNVLPIVSTTGLTVPTTQATTVASINTNLTSAPINPDGGVSICFLSGSTQQVGIITIGGSNQRQNSVTLSIRGTHTCP